MDGTATRIVTDQMTCVDAGRLGDFAGRLNADEAMQLDEALTWVLGLV